MEIKVLADFINDYVSLGKNGAIETHAGVENA